MVRKIISIALIIIGLAITVKVAFYHSEYSRTHKVLDSGLIEEDLDPSKGLIALASGFNSHSSMVKREKSYFLFALLIGIIMAVFGGTLLLSKPKVRSVIQLDYLYGDGEYQDENKFERWRL